MNVVEFVFVLWLMYWDSFMLMGIVDMLVEKIVDVDEVMCEDLCDVFYEIYECYYLVLGEGDLLFMFGLLLYELDDFEEVLVCFEVLCEQFGDDVAMLHNIKLCCD